PQSAGPNVLAGLEVRASGQIADLHKLAFERARAADHPGVACWIIYPRRDLAIGVAQENHLRPSEANRRNTPDQRAVGAQHRKVVTDTVSTAEVDFNRSPPICRIPSYHAPQLKFPVFLPLRPFEQFSQPVVFTGSSLCPGQLQPEFLILFVEKF